MPVVDSNVPMCVSIEEYQELIDDIVRDGRLYSSHQHRQVLKVGLHFTPCTCITDCDLQHKAVHISSVVSLLQMFFCHAVPLWPCSVHSCACYQFSAKYSKYAEKTPGKRRRQQPSADRNDVRVWPYASAWTRAESRSRPNSRSSMKRRTALSNKI